MTDTAPSGALLRDALGPASMPLDATTAELGSCAMSDDATLMRQLRAVRRAALQAREEAQLAYQFAPNSYTYGALAQIELILVRLAEIEP